MGTEGAVESRLSGLCVVGGSSVSRPLHQHWRLVALHALDELKASTHMKISNSLSLSHLPFPT